MSYKERHAKSRNSYGPSCSKRCMWAKCQKPRRLKCSRHLWAVAQYKRVLLQDTIRRLDALRVSGDGSKGELREFHSDIRKRRRSHYVGFSDEERQCGKWGLLKECSECGALIMKRLVCGREWCPRCGVDLSEHHKRRISRLIDRVYSMASVGYWVFQYPLVLRAKVMDVNELREAGNYISRMLRREGFTVGVRRWHYHGEPAGIEEWVLNDATIRVEIRLGKYHPHLNVLCAGGRIPVKLLRRIRALWTAWLEDRYGIKLNQVAPVHYAYSANEAKIWHWIEYITRPTLKVITPANRKFAESLCRFKNTSWFGVFTDDDKARGRKRFEAWVGTLSEKRQRNVVDVEAWDRYESGLCPACGGGTDVLGIVPVADYVILTDYGGGLYLVRGPPEWV